MPEATVAKGGNEGSIASLGIAWDT